MVCQANEVDKDIADVLPYCFEFLFRQVPRLILALPLEFGAQFTGAEEVFEVLEFAGAERQSAATESDEQSVSSDSCGDADPQPADPESAESSDEAEIESGDPWLPRIGVLDGVAQDALSGIHGRLIAAGHLVFQFRNRTTGMEYRVSHSGKQFLSRQTQ